MREARPDWLCLRCCSAAVTLAGAVAVCRGGAGGGRGGHTGPAGVVAV